MNGNEYGWKQWGVGVIVAILVFVLIALVADLAGKYLDRKYAPDVPVPQILPIYDPGFGVSPLQP